MISNLGLTSRLDDYLRLRLADLPPFDFERFFLEFLNAGISLVIERDGKRVECRVIEANTHAASSGLAQQGIDLFARVEGPEERETWAFQCKRHKKWNVSKTQTAILKARCYPARHYFLLVACNPAKGVQDEIDKHSDWSFWNLDRICSEFRQRVPQSKQAQVLYFLSPEELKRFAPYATDALVLARDYFAKVAQANRPFQLVGRKAEMERLESFALDLKTKVLIISGRGGEGKTRLLCEFVKRLEHVPKSPEVLFLNPYSSGDLTLALLDKDTPRVIVVDDAHRMERVSHELLNRVADAPSTKLVLATRPQASGALENLLAEHGLSAGAEIKLQPLEKKELVSLATEVLGVSLKTRARELIRLTGDSVFLTIIAGDLIRTGELEWGTWGSHEKFRKKVFRSFESENLIDLPESDKREGSQLLRIIAMVAPVTPSSVFYEKAATCLEISRGKTEELLHRFQAAGIVSSEESNLRVIPDLFGDFLVFDTVFDPNSRLPDFPGRVLKQFSAEGGAILRNLAEATWIAGSEGIGRDKLLAPLLQAEFERFEASNFFERSQILKKWAAFSLFIPGESLKLASKAIELKTFPRRRGADEGDDGINSHRYVKRLVTGVIKPIALLHDAYRAEALDFLWRLGLEISRESRGSEGHPWSVITEVLDFSPHKPIEVTKAALQWIEDLVQGSTIIEEPEKIKVILSTFLRPCFECFVRYSEWKGRVAYFSTAPVDISRIAPLRAHALKILIWVIEHGSLSVAISAVHATGRALDDLAGGESERLENANKFRKRWSTERVKALSVLEYAIEQHSQPLMMLVVQRLLIRRIAYKNDARFTEAAHSVLSKIKDSMGLRVLAVITSQDYFEFADELGLFRTKTDPEQMKQYWEERVGKLAAELLESHQQAAALIAYLEDLAKQCLSANYSPNVGPLFTAISRLQPDRALDLIEELIWSDSSYILSADWQNFLYGFNDQAQLPPLLQRAAHHPLSKIRCGVIDFFRFRSRGGIILSDAEKALLEKMADLAEHEEELTSLVRLLKWVGESCAGWGFNLLSRLPLAMLTPKTSVEALAALNPYYARDVVPPLSTVEHVLDALVPVPKIKVDHYGGGWDSILKHYPHAVYDFALKRASYYERLDSNQGYQVLPHRDQERFQLKGLIGEPDFQAICEFLWEKIRASDGSPMAPVWRGLFQGVALESEAHWLPKLSKAVKKATTIDELRSILEVLYFDGSLVVFHHPDLTKAVLQKARSLDLKGYERIRDKLYTISGPIGRVFHNGELDKEYDYVRAEAVKAATVYAQDPVLGPFYRWVIEREKGMREETRRQHKIDKAALDDL